MGDIYAIVGGVKMPGFMTIMSETRQKGDETGGEVNVRSNILGLDDVATVLMQAFYCSQFSGLLYRIKIPE